jgi:alpha-tubulin suppressor-like RCC1 family protein
MRRLTRPRAIVVTILSSMLALVGAHPIAASGPGIATMSVGGGHTCAARTDGTVWCWGYDAHGQLGDGTTGDVNHIRSSPVRVRHGSSALRGVAKVAAGDGHTCVVRTDSTVWCWGEASSGQVGDGTTGDATTHLRLRPVQVRRGSAHLTSVTQLAAGGGHTCALRTDGSVWCWGTDGYGQLGDGTTGDPTYHLRTKAVRVRKGDGYLGGVVAIAAGFTHSCAVRKDGSAWCWGDGGQGQLGDGTSGAGHHRTKATRVRHGSGYLTKGSGIAASVGSTCARRTDGTAWCWGYAENGQLGDGTTGDATDHLRTEPVRVRRGSSHLTGVAGIGAGADANHACARRTDGTAVCWGPDNDGRLGDGTTGDPTTHLRLKAVRVIRSTGPFTGVRKLGGGEGHTCALRTDHTVWCWGSNSVGQLGRGTHDSDPHPYPRKVSFP